MYFRAHIMYRPTVYCRWTDILCVILYKLVLYHILFSYQTVGASIEKGDSRNEKKRKNSKRRRRKEKVVKVRKGKKKQERRRRWKGVGRRKLEQERRRRQKGGPRSDQGNERRQTSAERYRTKNRWRRGSKRKGEDEG